MGGWTDGWTCCHTLSSSSSWNLLAVVGGGGGGKHYRNKDNCDRVHQITTSFPFSQIAQHVEVEEEEEHRIELNTNDYFKTHCNDTDDDTINWTAALCFTHSLTITYVQCNRHNLIVDTVVVI